MKLKNIILIFLLIFALYPITGLIQIMPFTDITPFTKYKEFMEPVLQFIVDNFSWFVIAFVTYLVVKRLPEVMYNYQETIRKRQYTFELARWEDTPYISPLLLFYMMCPPVAYSNRVEKHANNDFYPRLVRDFQNRVAIVGSFNRQEPRKMTSVLKVIGPKIMGLVLFWIISLGVLIYKVTPEHKYHNFIEGFTQTSAKFLIPVVLFLIGNIVIVLISIVLTAPRKIVEKKLKNYFSQSYLHHEPRIPWVDVLPDTDKGEGIYQMWVRDCYRRIELTYQLKGQSMPNDKSKIIWDNPSIPRNPFPDNLDMSWVHDAREHIQAVKERWQVESENKTFKAIQENKARKKGQVVVFGKKR